MSEDPLFFKTPADFRAWLEKNHGKQEVQWVGYYKVATGRESIRWEESVEEALCFGWIDGLRKSIDEESYKIRFTPRRPDSHWSRKNIETVEKLLEEGRMQPAGREAWEQREEKNSARASYERGELSLKKEYEERIRAHPEAWTFFQELAPSYTRSSVKWVMSAKQEKTRRRRLGILIESCKKGEKIPLLRR